MKSTKVVIIVVTSIIGYFSPRVLLTTLLMVSGVLVNSLLRSVVKKESFQWPVVFHKGCATIHWAFISFYLFSYDKLRSDLRFRPVDIFMFILLASFVLYVTGNLVTRKVLENVSAGFLKTKEERENAWLATLSLFVALLFATVLTQSVPLRTDANTTQSSKVGPTQTLSLGISEVK
jgi:hypothetical protein